MTTLDERLLSAHARDDKEALVTLYTEAADEAAEVDAACFYLTHAYVFALETNHSSRTKLHARLVAKGREA